MLDVVSAFERLMHFIIIPALLKLIIRYEYMRNIRLTVYSEQNTDQIFEEVISTQVLRVSIVVCTPYIPIHIYPIQAHPFPSHLLFDSSSSIFHLTSRPNVTDCIQFFPWLSCLFYSLSSTKHTIHWCICLCIAYIYIYIYTHI